jgi:hypothetical protein
MTNRLEMVLLLTCFLCAATLLPRPLLAQGCDADEAMVASYVKDITALADTTRKESLEQFEKSYHQKTSLTKLTLSLGLVKELESCLDKDAQDPTATKEQAAGEKAKEAKYAKLQSTIEKDQKDLKAAGSSKDAKALIGKFDFAN